MKRDDEEYAWMSPPWTSIIAVIGPSPHHGNGAGGESRLNHG
jgi:hypothetical protein